MPEEGNLARRSRDFAQGLYVLEGEKQFEVILVLGISNQDLAALHIDVALPDARQFEGSQADASMLAEVFD